MCRLLPFYLCVYHLVATLSVLAGSPSIEAHLQAYENSLTSLESFDFSAKVTNRTFTEGSFKTVSVICSRQRYFRGKHRVDVLDCGDPNREATKTRTWDNVSKKSLDRIGAVGTLDDNQFESSAFGPDGVDYLSLIQHLFGDLKYSRFFLERDSSVEVHGNDIVLVARPAPEKSIHMNIYGGKMVLRSDQGFMPSRLEIHTPKDGGQIQIVCEVVNNLTEVEPGIWLPIQSQIRYYKKGEVSSETSFELNKAQMAFNRPISSDTFDVNFPPGTRVTDRIRKMTYVVGSDNKEDDIEYFAGQSAEVIRGLPANSRNRVWWSWAFLALNGFVLLCLLSAVVFRWFKKVPSHDS